MEDLVADEIYLVISQKENAVKKISEVIELVDTGSEAFKHEFNAVEKKEKTMALCRIVY